MKCPKCKKIFYEVEVFRRHIRFFHNVKDGEVIVCTEDNCFQIFMKVFNFIRHYKKCHPSNMHEQPEITSADHLLTNKIKIETVDFSTNIIQSDNNMPETIESVENGAVQDSNYNISETIENVKNAAAQHCIDLLAQPNVTVTAAVNSIEKTSDLMSHCILYLKQRTKDILIGNVSSEEHNNFLQEFDILSLALKNYSTVSKLQNLTINWPTYVAPLEIELGVRYENRYKLGVTRMIEVKETFQHIPLKKLLIKFLSSDGVLNNIMQYKRRAKNEVNEMINIQQGSYYKNHQILSTDDNVIALEFYIDDVEITNPLGSKAGIHKLGLVYFTIKDLPLIHMSSLENIFLCNIHYAMDVKKYGYGQILQPLIRELEDLKRDGITIYENGNIEHHLKFILWQFTGDNLGIQKLFGLVEGFTGNYYCRFCTLHKNDMNSCTIELSAKFARTPENYEEQLANVFNGTKTVSETGINGDCCLNTLGYWHVVRNISVDCMHDIFEGWGSLELRLVLRQFIFNDKFFTLSLLNARLKSFNYGFCDVKNKPTTLTKEQLNKPGGSTGQSAAQMWCLIRTLPLLIGDKIPSDNNYWHLYLLILNILDIVMAPRISISETFLLQEMIHEHHKLFLFLFPERRLTPKQHFLIHYPRVIRELGPPIRYWTMRNESRHFSFKRMAASSGNFINVSKTLAYRNQIKQAAILGKKKHFGEFVELRNTTIKKVALLENYELFLKTAFDTHNLTVDSTITIAKSANIHSTIYRAGEVLLISYNGNLPLFGVINQIISSSGIVYFYIHLFITLGFEDHFHAYVVRYSEDFIYVKKSALYDFRTYCACKLFFVDNENYYICLRNKVCSTKDI